MLPLYVRTGHWIFVSLTVWIDLADVRLVWFQHVSTHWGFSKNRVPVNPLLGHDFPDIFFFEVIPHYQTHAVKADSKQIVLRCFGAMMRHQVYSLPPLGCTRTEMQFNDKIQIGLPEHRLLENWMVSNFYSFPIMFP